MQKLSAMFLVSVACVAVRAEGGVIHVQTRQDVQTTVFWKKVDGANATVLVFPGDGGDFGKVEDGRPTSNYFLVRSMADFIANGSMWLSSASPATLKNWTMQTASATRIQWTCAPCWTTSKRKARRPCG
jgi:hypothetical protein